jgi:DNA-3-methyladenine glycosylase I
MERCGWAKNITDEEYLKYHDEEWSEPLTSDRDLFELLCLEGAQAGLSWQTILKKRKAYRKCFHRFELEQVVGMPKSELDKITLSGGVVKHRGKVDVCEYFF